MTTLSEVSVLVGTSTRNRTQKIRPGSGDFFRDFKAGPEMVIVPSGTFEMGLDHSPDNHEAHLYETPRHRVTIPEPFAVGRFSVTRGEFDAFVKATHHDIGNTCGLHGINGRNHPDGRGFIDDVEGFNFCRPGFDQTERHPATCVSWFDAKDYVDWISRRTGKTYRLLSEAEREYITRAGTAGPFWWGSEIDPNRANYRDNPEVLNGTRQVDAFAQNPWGIYQVHGNLHEWVEDHWHNNYVGAPSDGSAWVDDGNSSSKPRVLRGGGFAQFAYFQRSSCRSAWRPNGRDHEGGFRVARTL